MILKPIVLLCPMATLGSAARAATSGSPLLPPAGSVEARGVDSLFSLLLIVSATILAVVLATILIFVLRYRRREDHAMASQASPSCQPCWYALAAVACLFVTVLFVLGEKSYTDLTTSPRHAYEVFVTATDAQWTFEHPNGKIQDDGQLFVPADRPVRFVMTSTDLSYAMKMPDFRLNQALVPGRQSSLWFQAAPGQYLLQGSEYCGPKFGAMQATMTASSENDFQAALDKVAFWLDRYANTELHKAGYRLYANCKSCHTLDGSRLVGPSFQETFRLWGKERTLADGRKAVVDGAYVRKSLLTPGADVVADFKNEMTPFAGQFREREILALIQFIQRLDEVVDEQGNLKNTEEGSP